MEKIIIFDKQKIKLEKEITTIGRGPECDIHLNDEQVSRYHGRFIKKGDDLYYEDNKSSNGSYLNNKLISSRKKIKEGDVIQISSFVLKVDLEIPTRKYPALDSDKIKDGIGCPNCGKTVSTEARFCVFCGAALKQLVKQNALPCPECGKLIPIGSKYCNYCGVDLSAETYDLDLTEITPVFAPVPDSAKGSAELSTIPLENLTKSMKRTSDQTTKKDLKKSKKLKKVLSKKDTSSVKAKVPSIKSKTPSLKAKTSSVKTDSRSLKIDKKQIKVEDVKSVPKSAKKIKAISPGKPAGFWIRTFSGLIDIIFYIILFSILFIAPAYFTNPFKINFKDGINLNLLREIHKNIRLETYIGLAAGAFFLALFYFISSTARKGGTPGKRIFGLYVFDYKTSKSPISRWRAFFRFLSYLTSIITVFIGFIIAAFKKNKRTLHDLIAGTQVCHRKK